MNINQQFAVSCHVLAILAAYPDTSVTSESIASSVDTNPVVIRRLMAHLRQHTLVESRSGASGGWRLARPASQVSLRDVFQAVSHVDLFAMHQHPNPNCPIGGNIQVALEPVFADAQQAMEMALDAFSVADILQPILEKANLYRTRSHRDAAQSQMPISGHDVPISGHDVPISGHDVP